MPGWRVMTDPARPDDPGYSRDEDMEADRGRDRPADADMDAFDREADRAPDRSIHVSPDPDDPSGVNGGVTGPG